MKLLIGTYADASAIGIFPIAIEDGKLLMEEGGFKGVPNPSYLALSEDKKYLYAVAETGQFEGNPGGGVAVIDMATGEVIQTLTSGGFGPCHISLTQGWAFAANYGSGHTAIYKRLAEGRLELYHVIEHKGSGPDPRRQEGPHAHFVQLSPDGQKLLICDLGLDALMVYPFDNGNVGEPKRVTFGPGAGPRHIAISACGTKAYVVQEMGSQVCVVDIQADYQVVQTVEMLDAPNAKNTGGAIRISPDGKYVYATNRGEDTIAAFPVQADGTLGAKIVSPCGGKTPRDILPVGSMLISCNQDDNSVTLLAAEADGTLQLLDKATLSRPVCAIAR